MTENKYNTQKSIASKSQVGRVFGNGSHEPHRMEIELYEFLKSLDLDVVATGFGGDDVQDSQGTVSYTQVTENINTQVELRGDDEDLEKIISEAEDWEGISTRHENYNNAHNITVKSENNLSEVLSVRESERNIL